MGSIGFEHARLTTAELPNGPRGRNFAATPPLKVGRHRNQPIITSVGRCDARMGHGHFKESGLLGKQLLGTKAENDI